MEKVVNPKEILLDNILLVFESEFFGKDKAARIVGGERKLERLIAEGKIEAEKRIKSRKGKWYCNAAQVLMNCRNARPRRRKAREGC